MENMVEVFKLLHRGELRIGLRFAYKNGLKDRIKMVPRVRYSQTQRCWYLPYDTQSWLDFKSLDIAFIISDQDQPGMDTENHESVQTGTALTLPTESDNAGIAAPLTDEMVANSEDPSNGNSKASDIRLTKGGREVIFAGGRFYIKTPYNEPDVQFLKSLKGWWNNKIMQWIVKGSSDNLKQLQARYSFWDEVQYGQIESMILNVECPYLVTIYRKPEYVDQIIVVVSGYKANISIIKHIVDRCYQKDKMRWLVPADPIIVEQLIAEYTRDGAIVENRLPDNDYDYHKKDISYGDLKSTVITNAEENLVPILNEYIDTLIALKRSKNTIRTYLTPFIKFIKHIGVEHLAVVQARDVEKYIALLVSQKVSDGFIHNAFNAIMFYYRDVKLGEIMLKQPRRPKKDDSLPSILSTEEVDRILRALQNLKHTTILYTFYSSGMRLSEILHLRVEDIWWDRDQLMVKNGKGRKDRVVPLSSVLKELFKLYFDEYKPIYWVFEGQDRKHSYSERSVQKVVKSAAKAAKVSKKVTPHSFRHCYATHLMDGGTDVRYIQELLGHSDIKTTLIYTHVTNRSIGNIESPLDKLMKGDKDVQKFGTNFGKPES